ncbi:hypothetical protein PSV08DRAFT_369846 [Bipolaris maydis]|uniref:uncharacterized protein n=1 Tax=Cochliobolus heterostrophus TaxID=5016 RepID=UPI0024D6DFAB|nr:hypothetical protein J3E73DRAFT_389504 [Bipolaris maydis]KAJ6273080.1 hypothetical protein PSV08DRAFT_369846 [Bipolaris maydis]KAJ6284177.1 hypothetical protein J3E71DRAFT_360351 [Bipolaris maydis]
MKSFFSTSLLLQGVVGLRTIKNDVIVVGGGSIIIEKSSALGSHANTYYYPIFKTPWVANRYLTKVNVAASPYVPYNATTNLDKEFTLYVIRNYGLQSIYAFVEPGGSFAFKNVDDFYVNVTKILGDRVLLSSTVQSIKRSESSAIFIIKMPNWRICYKADKIVMAGKNTHIAITRNLKYNNTSIAGVRPSSSHGIARLPGIINTSPTGFSDSSYFSYYVQSLFKSQIQKLIANEVLPASRNKTVEWLNHDQYINFVSNEDLQSEFYNKLNDLQGTSSTYYVGAIWAGQNSAYI